MYTLHLSPAPVYASYNFDLNSMAFATAKTQLNVKAVPNPYLVSNEWERHPDFRKLKFVNLPDHCTIRIYTLAGDLIRTIHHDATNAHLGSMPDEQGGDEDWDVLTSAGEKPAPGIYLFHIDSPIGTQIGKLAIVY